MIALLLAVAAQAAAPAPLLGPIGQQRLPAKGCAAYLWNAADRQLVAMAVADPATIRVAIGGRTVDLALATGSGPAKLGFADSAEYRGDGITARLTMEVVQQEQLIAGARVPSGSLQIDRPGQDGVVVPVAGLIGCRA
ncbi:hypothetical protein M9979_06665 [Sphingomonas sp. RP10(2022)]|uniref:Uncharacterized protein n=1 Tax=Sphingomonas liriopis TaxID=2949094 RepID=A0A9X2HXE1_9SPHN|nr:hypothetical protein [Sphingomonas liriopis]MCP3734555.1 hypothetical protein [Sphingomonas liriopis]